MIMNVIKSTAEYIFPTPAAPANSNTPPKPKKVFVVGGDYLIEKMFKDHDWEVTHDFNAADLFCFTGGSDVSPSLYGQKNVASGTNPGRDEKEQEVFFTIKKARKPMVGICRGAQFLNVMNGGTMWQDVDGHLGIHEMYIDIDSLDESDNDLKVEDCPSILVTSTHHQMMRPDVDGVIVGIALGLASSKMDDNGIVKITDEKYNDRDVEVVFYPDTKSLCFQPHPEYTYTPEECTEYFFGLLTEKLGM